MTSSVTIHSDVLHLEPRVEANRIADSIRQQVFSQLKRKGAVIGISGGIDSSVVASLCVRALGKDRVVGVFMPEEESFPDSLRLGRMVAENLGIRSFVEDISLTNFRVQFYGGALQEIATKYSMFCCSEP